MTTTAFKEQAHRLVDSLPETADWDDLIEKARYLAAVQRGMEAADRGDFASPERVRAMFAKWGVDVSDDPTNPEPTADDPAKRPQGA